MIATHVKRVKNQVEEPNKKHISPLHLIFWWWPSDGRPTKQKPTKIVIQPEFIFWFLPPFRFRECWVLTPLYSVAASSWRGYIIFSLPNNQVNPRSNQPYIMLPFLLNSEKAKNIPKFEDRQISPVAGQCSIFAPLIDSLPNDMRLPHCLMLKYCEFCLLHIVRTMYVDVDVPIYT